MTLIKDLECGPNCDDMAHAKQLCERAANAIKHQRSELSALRAKNEKLIEALRFYAGHWDDSTVNNVDGWEDDDTNWITEYAVTVHEAKIIYSLLNN